MAHSDAGHYAAKHPPGARPDEGIASEIRKGAAAGKLACAEAERIAAGLGLPMAEVGRTLDLLELRIATCQLGLFGHDRGKALRPVAAVDAGLEGEIRACLTDGRLSCRRAWEIADRRKIARRAVAEACEALAIRIKPCQLGAF
jgi:hypothetical protein